ncbi:Cell cycle control protein 50A [Clonorchis sinensis]|uniref:Cell cycle control protein 50A n=1 Tax=Clonorchis sinensis TaxID=79923 RepID=A0A8T1MQ19_CLOSI|nr:Cell cycle control protein 50A [Clonorchis sinensis]
MPEDPDGSTEKLVNKPKNTRFHQQRLKSWRPVLTAKGAYPLFLTIGLVFIPIGIALLITSNKVFERVFEYTHCERSPAAGVPSRCSEEVRAPAFYQNYQSCPCTVSFTLDEAVDGQVYFFYGLSNFFQNHRRYIMSKDDAQLLGGTGPLSDACEPYRTNSQGVPYAPCGAIANSLFNDTFTLKYHGSPGSPLAQPVRVSMSNKNIAWRSDVEKKFGQPPASYWGQTVKPDSWPVPAVNRSPEAFRGDEELIVWMRPAGGVAKSTSV